MNKLKLSFNECQSEQYQKPNIIARIGSIKKMIKFFDNLRTGKLNEKKELKKD